MIRRSSDHDGYPDATPQGLSDLFERSFWSPESLAQLRTPGRTASVQWIAIARRCPALARILRTATSGSQATDRGPDHWTQSFATFPDWQAIATLLSNEPQLVESARDAQILQTAEISRNVAVETGWCLADRAFWTAVSECPSELNAASTFEPLEWFDDACRCHRVAQLLAASAWTLSDFWSPSNESSTRTAIASRLDDLRLSHPDVDWDTLSNLAADNGFPVPLQPSDEQWRLLEQCARNAHLQQQLSWHEQLQQIQTAGDPPTIARSLATLMGEFVDGPPAVWIALDDWPEGVGILSHDPDDSPVVCSRSEFELEHLPALHRCSESMTDQSGRVIGCVFFRETVLHNQAKLWMQLALRAIRAVRERRVLEHSHRAYRQQAAEQIARSSDRAGRQVRRAVAEIGAGAAHEINNPLAAIDGTVRELLEGEVVPTRRQSLKKILGQVQRIHGMIRDLHLIGRSSAPAKAKLPIAPLLSEAVASAGKRIQGAHYTLDDLDDDWTVLGNHADLVRLISEVAINAAEAAGPKGRVRVTATENPDSACELAIDVIDNGRGFSAADREHAYTPFYSGRLAGRGLGMGLPVALQICTEHGGRIVFGDSRPNRVTIYLPLVPT